MPTHDDNLLARLNALKPSTVTLNSDPRPTFDVEVSKPPSTLEDKLADRLKNLRAGGSPAANSPVPRLPAGDAADILTSQIGDEVASEPLADWQNGGNEQSIDDLLAELETNEQVLRNPDDPDDVAALLREAREALPPPEQDSDHQTPEPKDHDATHHGNEDEDDAQDNEKSESHLDEAEANDYVQRILAELDYDRKHGIIDPEPDDFPQKEPSQTSTHPRYPSASAFLRRLRARYPFLKPRAQPPFYPNFCTGFCESEAKSR
jgi:hypothetical protein